MYNYTMYNCIMYNYKMYKKLTREVKMSSLFKKYQEKVTEGSIRIHGFETALVLKIKDDLDSGSLHPDVAMNYIAIYQREHGVDLVDFLAGDSD